MLLHQPELPFLTVSGEYYPLSSTPSTLTQTPFPGTLFALPLPTTIIQNYQVALRSLVHPNSGYQSLNKQSTQPVCHSSSPHWNTPTPSTNTMPRQSISKAAQDLETSPFPAPHVPVIVGGKRDASGQAIPRLTATTGKNTDSEEAPQMRLPPKLKEAERMMHVQRWVNHLPGPATDPDGIPVYWGHSNSPGFRNIDEDRELTPPPSRAYLSRLPFTPEEEQTMLRFFSDPQHHTHAAGAMHNSYPSKQPNFQAFHNPRPSGIRQNPITNPQFPVPNQQSNRLDGDLDASGAPRRAEQDATGGNRYFADWEIRLISHLFHDYFPGHPEPMGAAGVVPSVGEVRSRIAKTRLKDTRSATAVRAKIKRMQSSGTWVEYQ